MSERIPKVLNDPVVHRLLRKPIEKPSVVSGRVSELDREIIQEVLERFDLSMSRLVAAGTVRLAYDLLNGEGEWS